MFEIDLGEFAGGRQHFQDIASLQAMAERERDLWTNEAPYRQQIQNRHDDIAAGLREIPGRWQDFRTTTTNLQNQGLDDTQIHQQLTAYIKSNRLIGYSSGAGQIIRECNDAVNVDGALGASQFFRLQSNTQLPSPMRKSQYDGYLYAWARHQNLDTHSAASSRASLRRTLNEISDRERDHHGRLSEIENQLRETINVLNSKVDEQNNTFSKFVETARDEISHDRSTWENDWNQQRELFVE